MDVIKKDWGILTDGALWRLFSREVSGDESERYFEFNLNNLVQSMISESNAQDRKEVLESAKYFYFFFSKRSFVSEKGEETFVNEILRYSKKYINKVEEDLKLRFVSAMNYACNGFYRQAKKSKETTDITFIRNVAESCLFNTLFIKSLESKNVLPMNDKIYKPVSLSLIIDKIEKFDPHKDDEINIRNLKRTFGKANGTSFDYSHHGYEIHDKIVRLTKIIHDGDSKKDYFGFGIKGFKESIFSTDEWRYFNSVKLTNGDWVKVLFELGYATSDIKSRTHQQIPYNFFSPRQLGSIYESFLEFQLAEADQNMVFEKKQWKQADFTSKKYREIKLPCVKKGELFFTPDNKERKATGSYYTPDYIVQYIVKKTLGNLFKLPSKEILKTKVCDPAMGSGHFLVIALKHLTSAYLEALGRESSGDVKLTLAEAKRCVLDACIFGVDINARAVKLAKMSLWLESAHIGHKLERLNDQLVVGDSLDSSSFDWSKAFPAVFKKNGFSAIVGNPPYVKNSKVLTDRYSSNYRYYSKSGDLYILFVERSLSLLNEKGKLGMIIPNKFMIADYGRQMRLDLVKSKLIDSLLDFEHAQVFDGVMTYTCLMFLDHLNKNSLHYMKIRDIRNYVSLNFGNLKVRHIDFSDIKDIWDFGTIEVDRTGCVNLGDIAETMYQGLATTCDPVYILKKTGKHFYSKYKDDLIEIEKGILKPLLRGKDLKEYKLPDAKEWAIFPYTVNSHGKYDQILIEEMKVKYPKALKYLNDCRDKLDMRENGKFSRSENWHLYTQEHNLGYFESPKIITKVMSKKGCFAVDKKGGVYFVGGGTAGGYGIILKNEYSRMLNYVAAILNSSLIFEMNKSKNSVFKGGFYSYSKKTLADIPIKLHGIDSESIDQIDKIVEELMRNGFSEIHQARLDELINQIYELEKKATDVDAA